MPLDAGFEALLRESLAGQIPPAATLHGESDLTAYGIDSLTIVRLLVAIEEVFAVRIPDEMIAFEIFATPGSLWTLISGLMEEPSGR